MLPQLSGRLPQLPAANLDQQSPYLLQYKVFVNRLKRQEKQIKGSTYFIKNKRQASQLTEDYLEITKSIISKKQNFNMLEGVPCPTEPSIEACPSRDELVSKTRKIFEDSIILKNKKRSRTSKDQAMSELRQNFSYQYDEAPSRIKSQANTNALRAKSKNSEISFIGYKKDKRALLEKGFKKIWGVV